MSERIEGLSIGLDLDSVKVESGLQDLNKKLALVNSEMKANLSAFDKGDASLKKYQTQLDGLNKKLDIQKTKVDGARQAYEKMAKAHGDGSKEAEAAATAYNKELASLNNLERYIGSVTTEMNKSQSAFTKYGNQLTGISEKAGKLGDGLTKTVTPAVLALGAAAVLSANNVSDATAKIQNNLGGTAKAVTGLDGLTTLVNGFKSAYDVKLFLSSSLFDVLDKMKDTTGKYHVFNHESSFPSGVSFKGHEVIKIDDTEIGTLAGDLKGFVGDSKQFIALFNRKLVTVKWNNSKDFTTPLLCSSRFDTKVADTEAGYYITYTA